VVSAILLFFRNYQFVPLENEGYPLLQHFIYIATMLTGYFQMEGPVYLPVGFMLFLFIVFLCFYSLWRMIREGENTNTLYVVLFSFSAFGIFYCVATAVGRIPLGLEFAQSSRHMTLLLPAFLGCYFFLQRLSGEFPRKITLTLLLAWVTVCCIPLSGYHFGVINGFQKGKVDWIDAYLKTGDIQEAESISGLKVNVEGPFDSGNERLHYLRIHRLNLFKGGRNYSALRSK
jgi:hypothetical protein